MKKLWQHNFVISTLCAVNWRAQSGNFIIFLSLRFYVKPKLVILEVTKTANLTRLEALISLIMLICTFWWPEIFLNIKFRASENAKMAVFHLPESLKLISRKIWMIQKSWNFHTFWKSSVKPALYIVILVTHFSKVTYFQQNYEALA